jgi:hypothetical protein
LDHGTNAFALRRECVTGHAGLGKEKDFNFSRLHAIPSGPERDGLRGVGDDFQEEGLFPGFQLVEIIDGADAQVIHAPERGEAG